MRNKILIIDEVGQPSAQAEAHLRQQVDLEPIVLSLDFSNWAAAKRKLINFTESSWVPDIGGLRLKALGKLLAAEESIVLDKLRQVQPPAVLATTGAAAQLMFLLMSKGLYRGSLVLAMRNFSYEGLVDESVACYACANSSQSGSLKRLNVPAEKIFGYHAPQGSEKWEASDSSIREMGLLSTMPTVMFFMGRHSSSIESYRRLLRVASSFQVVVIGPESSIAACKAISAPPSHPVKYLPLGGPQLSSYITLSAAVVTDSLDYDVLEQAALNDKPIIVVESQDAGPQMAQWSSQGLVSQARVPAETAHLVERALQRVRMTNTAKFHEFFANSQAATPLADVLRRFLPEHELKVSNYQEKPR